MAIEPSIVSCKCGEKFYGEYDAGIAWNDPDIGIEWPLGAVGGLNKVVLSDKDKQLPSFVEFLNTYGENSIHSKHFLGEILYQTSPIVFCMEWVYF